MGLQVSMHEIITFILVVLPLVGAIITVYIRSRRLDMKDPMVRKGNYWLLITASLTVVVLADLVSRQH